MKNIKLGHLFKKIREHVGLSQGDVSENIVDQPVLSRMEQEGELPSALVLGVLFQRLGKSVSYFSALVTQEEYNYLTWRQNVIDKILVGECDVREFDNEIAKDRNINKKLQEQFATFWKAYLENNIDKMNQAIAYTVSGYPDELRYEKCYTADEFIFIILCIEKEYEITHSLTKNQQLLLAFVLEYSERQFEMEERVRTYIKAAILFSSVVQGESENKLIYLNKAFDLLRSLHKIGGIEEILIKKEEVLHYMNMTLSDEEINVVETLRWIRQRFNVECKDPYSMSSYPEYYLLHEMLKSYRVRKNMTVREVTEGTCSEKTYRALENGMRGAKDGTFVALANKLGISLGTYNTDVVTDSYREVALVNEIEKRCKLLRYDEALTLSKKLESSLKNKCDYPENRQFLKWLRTSVLFWKNCITSNEYLQAIVDALKITLKDPQKDIVFYTRQERLILCNIALAYKKTGETGKCIEILKKLWHSCQSSGVSVENMKDEVPLMLELWESALSDIGLHKESLRLALQGIKYSYRLNDGWKLYEFIAKLDCRFMIDSPLNFDNDAGADNNMYCKRILSLSWLYKFPAEGSFIKRERRMIKF